jgi:periplasmic glucans biosynthesis protein
MSSRFRVLLTATLLASVACARLADHPKEESGATALGGAAGGATAALAAPSDPPAFFEELKARARALAAAPARAPRLAELPAGLDNINYDAYRSIRFRPEKSLWRGEPGHFEVQFFHPGFGYRETVDMFVLGEGKAQPLPFVTEWFSYDGVPAASPGAKLGFTGLRVHAPLNSSTYRDEVVVFQGASYFRALGKGNVYGISARGLAIDLGESHPEEFPRFSELYLARPLPDDDFIWILALLESRRATGAYAFRVQPGVTTTMEVSAEISLREPLANLGLVPLSSMYLFGEDAPNRFGDFRPEVHDSDGLAMWSSDGEWLFRPLRNPPQTSVSSLRLDAPRGFGLVQRDDDFDHYQDLEARYQDRPSVWIEPISGFGKGSVRLLEMADELEITDNIAAAWVPDQAPAGPMAFRYRLRFGNKLGLGPGAHVRATRIGRTSQGSRFLVDFEGTGLGPRQDIEAVVSCVRGRVLERHVEVNPFTHGVRASFEVAVDKGARDAELRAFLRSKDDVLTETWSYLWQPTP